MGYQVNKTEALRYLGVKADPEGTLHAQMAALAEELQRRIQPRFTWVMADKAALALPGRTAERMLADCQHCAVLVCTLGAAFDLWVKREQTRDMSRAAMLDALGSIYVEAGCDAAEDAIRARFPGMHLTDRFSPGYGDLPIDLQRDIFRVLDCSRKIGLTLNGSLLMTPTKSVTALIGIGDGTNDTEKSGCTMCDKASCLYRRNV